MDIGNRIGKTVHIKHVITAIAAVSILKAVAAAVLLTYGHDIFAGGNDSYEYDLYARGLSANLPPNFWSSILRWLHSVGLYSRRGISLVLMSLSFFFIPYLTARISSVPSAGRNERTFWIAFLLTSMYPTLFYFSLDLYRDVFMLFCFLIAVWPVKLFFESKTKPTRRNAALLLLFTGLCFLLYLLRFYLGLTLFISLFLCSFFSFSRHSVLLWCTAFLLLLWALAAAGGLDRLFEFRLYLQTIPANTKTGILFDNILFFPVSFFKSALTQLFSFFFVNITTTITFLLEGLPFTLAFAYLLKNRRYADKFVDFLVVFFCVYGSFWLIGMDNVGSAVRYRIFNYIPVLISCMIVFQRKEAIENTPE